MTPILIISIIGIVALLLFAFEALITPGLGIAGVIGTLLVIIADSLVYYYYGPLPALLVFSLSTAFVLGFIYMLGHSRWMQRMALRTQIDSTSASPEQLSIKRGDTGHATTRLALIGNAIINGKEVEVRSEGDFLPKGTPIRVVKVEEGSIVVVAIPSSSSSEHPSKENI